MYGHYERECRNKKVDQNSGRANVSKEEEDSSEVMFLSLQSTKKHRSWDLWLLDSGCSNHMTGNKSLFSSLDSFVVTNIKLGDDFLVLAKGKGTIPVFTKKNENKFIHEVLYDIWIPIWLV